MRYPWNQPPVLNFLLQLASDSATGRAFIQQGDHFAQLTTFTVNHLKFLIDAPSLIFSGPLGQDPTTIVPNILYRPNGVELKRVKDFYFGKPAKYAIHADMTMYNFTVRMAGTDVVPLVIVITDAFSAIQ